MLGKIAWLSFNDLHDTLDKGESKTAVKILDDFLTELRWVQMPVRLARCNTEQRERDNSIHM